MIPNDIIVKSPYFSDFRMDSFTLYHIYNTPHCFPSGSDGKVSVRNAGDPGSIPGLGRFPGEGNGSPLQYSCLGNPMDRRAWQVTLQGVCKSQTQLSDFTFIFHFHALEK